MSDAPIDSKVPAAIVLHHPDLHLLDTQLSALEQGSRRLFLFANGPLAAEVEERLARLANAIILRSAQNVGLGEGLNAVARRAMEEGFQHLFLLDQDSGPSPEIAEQLRERFWLAQQQGKKVAVVGPRLVPPPNSGYRPIQYHWRRKETGEAVFVPTSGSLLSLSAFREVGPFRSDYFIGGIDVEWGLRAAHFGYLSLIAADLAMIHRWGVSVDGLGWEVPQILRNSPLRNYYYVRNAVDLLRSTPSRRGWRLLYGGRLASQVLLVLAFRLLDARSRQALIQGVRDGLSGKLGPAPDSVERP